jgi:hypothetical protein
MLLVSVAARAQADSLGFVTFGGGATLPVADSRWSDGADSGVKVFAGAGIVRTVGALATIEGAWLGAPHPSKLFQLFTYHERLFRMRILGHAVLELPHVIDPRLSVMVRAGIGADVLYETWDRLTNQTYIGDSRVHAGFGFEVGAAAWFEVALGIDVGVAVGVPMSIHHSDSVNTSAPGALEYTSVDIDLLAGVRLTPKR